MEKFLGSYDHFKNCSPTFAHFRARQAALFDGVPATSLFFERSNGMKTKHENLKQTIVKQLTSFHSITGLAVPQLEIDLYEIKIGKLVIDQILADLRSKGQAEQELVKRYRFKKVNDLPIDGQPEQEINQLLISAMTQVFLGSINESSEMVDKVLVPALLTVD